MATRDDHYLGVDQLGQGQRDLFVGGQGLIRQHKRNWGGEAREVFGLGLPTRKTWALDREDRIRIAEHSLEDFAWDRREYRIIVKVAHERLDRCATPFCPKKFLK